VAVGSACSEAMVAARAWCESAMPVLAIAVVLRKSRLDGDMNLLANVLWNYLALNNSCKCTSADKQGAEKDPRRFKAVPQWPKPHLKQATYVRVKARTLQGKDFSAA